jgi:hypothetical protein
MVDIINVGVLYCFLLMIYQKRKQMQSSSQTQNNFVVRDIKPLLKLFRALQKATQKKLLKKNKDLEEKAYKEAEKEFTATLKKWQTGFTLPPGHTNIFPHKTSEAEQKNTQDRCNRAIEVKAEKIYRSLDKKYDAELMDRDKTLQLLIKKIDYTITPLSIELRKCPEVNNTLLIDDWSEIREKFSVQDFMTSEMQEEVSRSTIALETLMRRLRQRRIKSLINTGKWFYEVTVKVIWVSVLGWLSKSRN